MKKFRLKPLGELRHKFNMTWFFVSLVMALGVSACSGDDDDDIVPTFPEKQTINSNGNETRELAFDAAANWQLTSSAAWCRFMVDGVEEYSLSGNAGKQTVTIQITDEAQKFDARTTAQLTLTMGNAKAIIADVVRNVKGRELKIYDLEGNEIEEIKVGYKDYNSFVVKANFHFAATNRPEWVNIAGNTVVGSGSDKNGVTGKVKVIDDIQYKKYQQKGSITFADDEGLASFDFPIVFDGMDRDKIEISGPNAWNWEVSLDGQTFTQTSSAGASGTTSSSTYNKFVPFTIQAYNDDFVMVYVEETETYPGYWNFWISSEDDGEIDWMNVTRGIEKEKIRFTVASTDAERRGSVLAFPRELYNQLSDDLMGNLTEMNPETGTSELKYVYQEQNLVMSFTQKQKKAETPDEQAFKITYWGVSATGDYEEVEIPCTKVTDEALIADYGTTEIYTIEQPKSATYITVNPFMEGDLNIDWDFAAYIGDNEASGVEGDVNNIGVSFDDLLKGDLHLIIKQNYMTQKVLIITPY